MHKLKEYTNYSFNNTNITISDDLIRKLLYGKSVDKQYKVSLFVFLLEFGEERFEKFKNEICIECIKFINEKVLLNLYGSEKRGISLKVLKKIYQNYKSGIINYNFDFDVEKAFIEYSKFYNNSDFDLLLGNSYLTIGELPYIYIKKSISNYISIIVNSILLQKRIRVINELHLKGLKNGGIPMQSLSEENLIGCSSKAYSPLSEFNLLPVNDFNFNLPIFEINYKEYFDVRRKPEKTESDIEYLRNFREIIKMSVDPLVLRQRIYSVLILGVLYPNKNYTLWPSILSKFERKNKNTANYRLTNYDDIEF